MKNIETDHYGALLSPDGLWFLLQSGEPQNARSLTIRNPFTVKTLRRSLCSHAISLDSGPLIGPSGECLNKIKANGVGRLCLPLPYPSKIYFLEQTPERFQKMIDLMELTSPVRAPIFPAWIMTTTEFRNQSRLTNVQPLVITGITPKWMSRNQEIIELLMTGTRSVILMGDDDVILPPGAIRLDGGELDQLEVCGDLRAIGAFALRQFMRGEDETTR